MRYKEHHRDAATMLGLDEPARLPGDLARLLNRVEELRRGTGACGLSGEAVAVIIALWEAKE